MMFRRLAVLLFFSMIAVPVSAPGGEEDGSHSRYIAGQFLVASPSMGDPRFKGTVIYMVGHDAKGAMGLVINRPFGSGNLSKLLEGFGVDEGKLNGKDADVRLYYGGPVDPGRGFILHSNDYKGEGTNVVTGEVSMTPHTSVLKAIAEGKGPKRSLVALGYAGWGAGQLESELARDDWTTAPAEPDLIFSDDPESIWEKASKKSGMAL